MGRALCLFVGRGGSQVEGLCSLVACPALVGLFFGAYAQRPAFSFCGEGRPRCF